MNSGDLPTDEEYLDSLFETPDNDYNPTDDPAFLKEAAQLFIASGKLPPGVDAEEFVKTAYDPRRNFRGPQAKILTEEAREIIPTSSSELLKTPIGFLHLVEFSGFAARTPRGNAVIILNKGIILHACMLSRCTLALTTWSSPEPFCRDHEPAAFADAIICLGRFACSNNDDYLRRITVRNCPSLDAWDIRSAKLGTIVELFVLLHEYGHVAGGHLDPSKMIRKYALEVFTQNHCQEHEADIFAFTHLKNRFGGDAGAFAVTMLFRFFDLIEHLVHGKPTSTTTHPDSRNRLEYLKKQFKLSDPDKQLFGRVESLFDILVKEAVASRMTR